MNLRILTLSFAAALCVCSAACAQDSVSANLGISKTKPESGPFVEVENGFMVPYTLTVPGTKVEIEMVPVTGGLGKLGTNEDADYYVEDEGPQVEVAIQPMWVAKYETTWEQYMLYMSMYKLFKNLQSEGLRKIDDDNRVDAVTAPTELYDPSYTFEYGQGPQLPAVSMTQYAAKQYTKWLSRLTDHQYRLPTEAEWEYACRAGSEDAYHFGDDESALEEFAWYVDNSDDKPHNVGEKQPNAFGLYDMHGNVMEWVIDGYTEDGYANVVEQESPSVLNAIQWPESFDNRSVRGGSFQDEAERVRCAARIGSEDEDWKAEDPNFPLSPWWYTDDPARGVGFRIVRSFKPLENELITKFWEIDNEDIQIDVDMRLQEGRGVLTPVDPKLADQIETD